MSHGEGEPVYHPQHGWGTFDRYISDGRAVVEYGRAGELEVDLDQLKAVDDPDIPAESSLRGCGFSDGYRVGPDGVDLIGNPATYSRPDLLPHLEYRQGASEGRARRIDEQLAAGTHHIQQQRR